jgi:hypothetical protein
MAQVAFLVSDRLGEFYLLCYRAPTGMNMPRIPNAANSATMMSIHCSSRFDGWCMGKIYTRRKTSLPR